MNVSDQLKLKESPVPNQNTDSAITEKNNETINAMTFTPAPSLWHLTRDIDTSLLATSEQTERGHMASALTARDYKNTGFGAAIFGGFYVYLYNDD